MATSQILKDLQKERATLASQLGRLNVAIAALGGKAGPAKTAGKKAKGKTAPKRRKMSAARKKAVSERMKRYWKERKTKERAKK